MAARLSRQPSLWDPEDAGWSFADTQYRSVFVTLASGHGKIPVFASTRLKTAVCFLTVSSVLDVGRKLRKRCRYSL